MSHASPATLVMLMLGAHMCGDYILQTQWMADWKMERPRVLSLHVTLYTLCFIPAMLFSPLRPYDACTFLSWVWVTHFFIDHRRWASPDPWPLKPILVDQSLHIMTLAALMALFGL